MKHNLTFRNTAWIFLIAGLVIQACNAFPGLSPSQTPKATLAPLKIPTSTFTEEACGYVWAYQELPELSELIQEKLDRFQMDIEARAQAFGEDCIYPNGEAEFHALETDFYVTLGVNSLTDENELGEWISKIMPELENIPPALLVGPKEGFCEFRFTLADNALVVRVPIEQFRLQANGLDGAEIYRLFAGKPK